MRSPQPETRELNHRLSVPTYLVANQLSILGRIGKSELVEASLSYFFALVAAYADVTGQTTMDAARKLVRAAPVCKDVPTIIRNDPSMHELLSAIIGEVNMTDSKMRDSRDVGDESQDDKSDVKEGSV